MSGRVPPGLVPVYRKMTWELELHQNRRNLRIHLQVQELAVALQTIPLKELELHPACCQILRTLEQGQVLAYRIPRRYYQTIPHQERELVEVPQTIQV